jgi:hypothetical protein
MTYILGFSGLVGAMIGNYTVNKFSRRFLFIFFAFLCGVCLALISVSIKAKNGDLVLLFSCLLNIFFQCSSGAGFWIYQGEVASVKAASVCIFMIMGITLVQSTTAKSLINALGIDGMFYLFAGYQIFTVIVLFFCLKETKGLNLQQKLSLYREE